MDPVSALGLAASIIAVIQQTTALITPATSALGPSKNDERELKRLQTTMIGLQIAYNNLEHHLKSNPGTAEALVVAIQQPIQNCKAILFELQLRLSKMTFVRKYIVGKKWDKEFNHFVKRLDEARQLFDVILQGDQSERLIKISQFMAEKSKDIEALDQRSSEMHLTVQTNQQKLEVQASLNQSELRSILQSYQNKMNSHEQRKLKDEVLGWLAVVDTTSNHDSACASHQPGTGDWFTKEQKYLNWLTEPNSFFWLNGKAGCGKTVLSSTIIESTIKYCNENEGCVVAYFYLSFTDAEKQKCSNMVRSLFVQLASQVDVTPECLLSLHRVYRRSEPPIKEMMQSLQTLLNEIPFRHVYIVVDAIDEIPNTGGRQEACRILDDLVQNAKTHVLTTSRREHDITEYMAECNSILDISIQNPEVDCDIQLYGRERLHNDKKLMKWSTVHSEIEKSLSRQADGMFRWAACQLDTLKNCRSVNAVRKALKSLPKTLDETYERILLAIDKDDRGIATEALRWLCFSERRMDVEELAEAAVFRMSVPGPSNEPPLEFSFNKDDRIQEPLEILEILSGLVVSEPSVLSRPHIRLAHFSIKEFLISNRLKDEVVNFSIDEHHAHETLARSCLYYIIKFYGFISDYHHHTPYHQQAYPMSLYASHNWVKHARKVDYESQLTCLIVLLLQADPPLRQCLLLELGSVDRKSLTLMPIYLASALDLYWCCKSLVEAGANVNVQGGGYETALQAASVVRSERIVLLLLNNGAYVNIQGGIYGTPLHAAVNRDNEHIVSLLLNNGADFNIRDDIHGTPLNAAVNRGNEHIVSLLLNSGADVNIQEGGYGTPLHAAVNRENEHIVLLLLNNGADVNIGGGLHQIPLHAAVNRGNEHIVSLLLNSGADVNIQEGGYGTALHFAVMIKSERIVSLLLNSGADVNIQGGTYGTALQAATGPGNERIVQILLNFGADISAIGPEGTALDKALRSRSTQIAVILLEHGATVSRYSYRGGIESEEALASRDFERFVEIEMHMPDIDDEARKKKNAKRDFERFVEIETNLPDIDDESRRKENARHKRVPWSKGD